MAKKTEAEKAAQKAVDEQAMKAARELRARREAARGPAPIDNEIHRRLPLTKAFVPLGCLLLVMFYVTRSFIRQGNDRMAQICGIALGVLFITCFVVWFVSRHQAKKLTAEMRERNVIDTADE